MKFRTMNYALGEAIRSLVKNRLMSVAAVITVSACIFMLSVSYCLAANLDYLLTTIEDTLKITVIIEDDADAQAVEKLLETIKNMNHVTRVTYISAQEALEAAKENWEDSKGILEGLDQDNPMPRYLQLDIESIKFIDAVALQLNEMRNPAIQDVYHGKEVAGALMAVNNVVRIISLIIIFGLAAISVVIITNTIRIAVNSRRSEITIMKYVGATDWFIRWPFVIEGLLIGIIGAVIPVVICWFGYGRVVVAVAGSIPFLNIDYLSTFAVFSVLIPFSALLGLAIGAIGSMTSVRKHLNV